MNPEQGPPHETALVPRLLVGLVGWVCRHPWAVLLTALLLGAASLIGSARYLQYHTQRSDLINPRKDYQQRWRQYLAEFGDDDDILVVVEGTERTQMKRALDAVASQVQEQPQLFDRLFYQVDLRGLRNRALLLLPIESIKPIQENLKTMGLLLEFGPWSWRSLSLLSLLREARHRSGQISPDRPLTQADDQFLKQLLAISRSAAATLDNPADYKNPWGSLMTQQPEQQDLLAEPQYLFAPDGALAFLLVRPIKEEGSFTAAHKNVEALRAIIAGVRGGFPGVDFGLTGLPVLETDEMVAAENDTRLASWLAIAGVTLLFFLVYRSVYYPLLTVATLLMGTAWAMGWTTLTVGHLNILSATFAIMLIGMGDYGVLWVMRYEAARRWGADVRTALLHTTTHVAVGNLTAASTLALAFLAAMLADFQAVAELGWIAGGGVLLCALACFTVLPSLLMIFDRRPLTPPSPRRGWAEGERGAWRVVSEAGTSPVGPPAPPSTQGAWLPWLAERPRWVLAAGVALTLGLGLAAWRLGYDHNLLHLQPRGLESVKWEQKLIDHTAGLSLHALSYRDSPEEALALKARYEQLPDVSRVVEFASLVPRDQPYKLELLADIRRRLKHLPARGEPIAHARPNLKEVKTELSCLIGQLQPLADADSQPMLAQLRQQLIAVQSRLSQLQTRELAEERLQKFDERLAGDLAEDLHKLRAVSTPAPITMADLPSQVRARYVSPSGKWLLQVFAKECLWDFEPLDHFARQVQTVDPQATGRVFGTVEGLKAMKNGFQWAGGYALLAIVVVLLIDFRSLKVTLLALTPLAMGVAMTLGIMVLSGVPLNPANMIAFPLILGVGIDNGVHILHDHLIRRRQGLSTISHAIGRGVLVKALTTMIGFGMLMLSSQRGLVGLGFILTVGVGCCLLTALFFLPALLRVMSLKRAQQGDERATVEVLRRAA